MKADESQLLGDYAEYLRLMGHKVETTRRSVWFSVRRGVMQPAFPFHMDEKHAHEARDLLSNRQAFVCRWFTLESEQLAQTRRTGAAVFVTRPPYELSTLDSKARNQTRRGLEHVKVSQVSFTHDIEQEAFSVYKDNVQRLGLFRSESSLQERWNSWARALHTSRILDFWAACHEGCLIAFAVTARTPWGLEILCQRSLASGLKYYPNNNLVFSIVRSAFKRGEPLVSYGLSEFGSDTAGLDHFKKQMGFAELQLTEHFTWNPWVRPLSRVLTPQRLRAFAQCIRRLASKA